MAPPRGIKEEESFRVALDAAYVKYPRADEWWLSWSWRLVRDPERDAFQIPKIEPATFIIKTDDYADYGLPPPSTLMYRFDDQILHMLGALIP